MTHLKKNRQHCDAPIVSWRPAGPFQQLVRHGSIHAIGQFPGRRWPKVAASRDFVPHRIVHQTLPSQHHIQGLKATALFVEIESIKRCGRALTSSAGPVLFIFTSEKITTVLVGPCMFKPTGPPHLTASLFGSCATAYTRTGFWDTQGVPQSVCVGLTQFQADLASRAIFKPRPVMHSVTKALEVILPSRFAYIAIPPSNNALTPRHATVETIAHAVVQDLHVLGTSARTVVEAFTRELSASGQMEASEHGDCWIFFGLIIEINPTLSTLTQITMIVGFSFGLTC